MPDRVRYEARLTAGLCASCGAEPCEDGRTKCAACLHALAAGALEIREQRRCNGLCPDCGERRPAKGRRTCKACLERARASAARRGHAEAEGLRTPRT